MADPEVRIFGEESADVEMQGDGGDVEVGETAAANGENGNDDERAGAEEGKTATRATFVEYVLQYCCDACILRFQLITRPSFLKSPAIELVIGSGSDQTVLTAHQALLVRSPFFASAIAESPVYPRILPYSSCQLPRIFLSWRKTDSPHRARRRGSRRR